MSDGSTDIERAVKAAKSRVTPPSPWSENVEAVRRGIGSTWTSDDGTNKRGYREALAALAALTAQMEEMERVTVAPESWKDDQGVLRDYEEGDDPRDALLRLGFIYASLGRSDEVDPNPGERRGVARSALALAEGQIGRAEAAEARVEELERKRDVTREGVVELVEQIQTAEALVERYERALPTASELARLKEHATALCRDDKRRWGQFGQHIVAIAEGLERNLAALSKTPESTPEAEDGQSTSPASQTDQLR